MSNTNGVGGGDKLCNKCMERKAYHEFSQDTTKAWGDGYTSICLACRRASSREWYAANKTQHIKKATVANKARRQMIKKNRGEGEGE